MTNIKQKDLEILSHLRKNSRQTLTQLSKKTHIPISTLFDRLKEHEKSLMLKHTTLLDFAQIGYTTRAQIYVKVPINEKRRLRMYLLMNDNVNNLAVTANKYDFYIDAIFKDLKEARSFSENMEKEFQMLKQETNFIVKDIKREGFMSYAS